MDEEQEYEAFNVDNDFEGGEWIDGEFYFKSKRRKRGQTKDEQIYGIFAGDASDSEDDGHGRRGLGISRRAKLTKPVGFVEGGLMNNQKTSSPERMPETDGHGGGSANGLGFENVHPSTLQSSPSPKEKQVETNEEEDYNLPTAFGRRIWETAKLKRQNVSNDSKSLQKTGKTSVEANNEVFQRPNAATFEAHTKGIGSKLLAKMGWKEGQGLGKKGEGISKPLEAKIRPKGMGMGYGDRREPRLEATSTLKQKMEKETLEKSRAGGNGHVREAKDWRKKRSGTAVKAPIYKTVEELLDEQSNPVAAAAPSTVILDMRGPQTRVLNTLEELHLHGKDELEPDELSGPMPELQYNLRLLVSLAEADVRNLDARLNLERDTVEILNKEVQRLELERDTNARDAQRVADFLSSVEKIQSDLSLAVIDSEGEDTAEFEVEFEKARLAFESLRNRYADEFVSYNGRDIVLGVALPGLSKILSSWSPLNDPEKGSKLFGAWQPLLRGLPPHLSTHSSQEVKTFVDAQSPKPSISADPMLFASSPDPLVRLAALIVLPPLHHDITTHWDPRNVDAMEKFLACWKPHLPAPVRSYILSHLVMPKLRASVDSWDPLSDPVAPHIWLHPWLVSVQT